MIGRIARGWGGIMRCGSTQSCCGLWLVTTLALACGSDGTGTGTGSTGSTGTSTGAETTTGAASTDASPTTDATPTTGGSMSASASSSGSTSSSAETDTSTGAVSATDTTVADTTGPGTSGDPGSSGTSSGGPACNPPLVLCGGDCIDLDLDPLHCGGCDQPCGDQELCSGGQCVMLVCDPGATAPCYSGPEGTEDVGVCTAGQMTCNDAGTDFGPCEGEVLPAEESCETEADDDCDGKVNQGCYLQNCKAIKAAQPAAKDGQYTIDLDGDDGPLPPVAVLCDMTLDGGGWTRFNWLHTDYTAGQDPLGQTLNDCNISDLQCRGRIPAGAVSDLMVKDLTDKVHAMWKFNGGVVSNAVLAALQSKTEYCNVNQGAFQPYFTNSLETYCGNGGEGGCDSFFYTSGACKGLGTWGLHWDGDGAWCSAAFKMGATSGGCGNPGDQGFLNDCACDDEKGELYYR